MCVCVASGKLSKIWFNWLEFFQFYTFTLTYYTIINNKWCLQQRYCYMVAYWTSALHPFSCCYTKACTAINQSASKSIFFILRTGVLLNFCPNCTQPLETLQHRLLLANSCALHMTDKVKEINWPSRGFLYGSHQNSYLQQTKCKFHCHKIINDVHLQ